MIIEHGLIYYIWTDGLKVAELGNNWINTRKNGMRIKVRSRGELNGKNNLGFDGNHWPGPTRSAHAMNEHGRESWIMSGQDSLSELSMHLLTGF